MDEKELSDPLNNVSLIKDDITRSNMGSSGDSEKIIQRLNDELREAQELANTEKHKCIELQGILAGERKENKQQADESAKQIKLLQGQLRQLQDEMGVLREQIDVSSSSRDELQSARDEVKALKRALDAATAERDRDVNAIQTNLSTVSKDLDKWRQTANKYEREIDNLQRDLQQQSKQWQKTAEIQAGELQSMQVECNGLQKECSVLRSEKQETVNKHQRERSSLQTECESLRAEKEELLKNYQKEKGNLQSECAALRSEKEAVLQNQKQLEKDLASSRAQNTELSNSLKTLERSQQELEKRLADLQLQHQQDSTKLQTQLEEADSHSKTLQREYEETKTELSDLKDKYEKTEQEKQSLTDELEECKANMKEMQERNTRITYGHITAHLLSGYTMRINHFSLFVILCLGVHRSAGNWIIDSFSIDEGYDGRFPYSLGVVKVDNKHTEFKILGQGVDVEPKGILQINEKTGEVTVHGPVDYEKYNVLKCTFKAYDVLKNVVDTKLGIEIVIMDANDNAPKFELALYKISIAESTMQGTEVISVLASDSDFTEHNRKINFTIVSVNPPPSKDLEFYLIHKDQTAAISFHGCLDHETADKYTIIVEAKDNGIKKQLSSSTTVIITIEDGNNHVPEIIKLTGTGKVKEGMENVLVSRLHVKDADTKGTMAWKALYRIHGDTHNYFKISTDPETNDGLLYVQKHLDFEDNPLKNVTISVENEISSHSCRLISRSKTGEWEVQMSAGAKVGGFSISGDTITGISSTGTTIYGTSASSTFSGFSGGIVETLGISTYVVTVTVEDVNEAPIFDKSKLQVTLSEFVKVGYYLETVTAKDPDVNSGNTFKYIIGHDPARWIAVDPVTGKITTAKNIDRESTFVVNNIYNATVLAVDNGKPQMTGTATLSIRITDENDNTPFLTKSTIDMCQSDGPSLANITAVDLDEDPYSGPFTFKLLGDVEGKWRLESSQGYSVNLVKESTVHSGISDLLVQVFDLQEENAVHNLTVTVCNCVNPAMPHCTNRQAVSSTPGAGLLGLIFLSILLIAVLLLLAFLVSCKKRTLPFPDEPMGQGLIKCNIEKPGTDCQVIFEDLTDGQKIVTGTEQNKLKGNANTLLITEQQRRDYLQWLKGNSNTLSITEQQRRDYLQWLNLQSTMDLATGTSQDHWRKFLLEQQHYNGFTRRNSTRWTMGGVSTMKGKYQDKYFRQKWAAQYSAENEIAVHREILFKVLNKAQHTLEAPGEELGDYAPHVYAEEGDTETLYELDAISIADTSFDLDLDLNQNYKFNTLASICMPCESAAYSANTYYVLETFNTVTEIQTESQNTNMNTQLLSTNCIFDQVINPTF